MTAAGDCVASVMLLRADGACLLQHRDVRSDIRHSGKWAPPGGHCQPGEPLHTCARRELLEETGYHCGRLHPLLTLVDDDERHWPAYTLTVFWTRYDENQILHCFEGQGVEFVGRAQAPKLQLPSYLLRIWDQAMDAFRLAQGKV